VPSAALGNFAWDWILAAWPGFEDIVGCIQKAYAQADVLLRLPLHSTDADAFPAFKAVEDVPLIARRASRSREATRAELNLPNSAHVVLLSFGAFSADGLNMAGLGELHEYTFVITPPLSRAVKAVPRNVLCLAEQPKDYVSLLAACDVVITKPGYGIVADCLANRVAVLFTSRGPFREYDVLANALQTLGRAHYVPREDLLAGDLKAHLRALEALPNTWTTQPMNGAQAVADYILKHK
jgi:UDP:flavonoid glycosyltransferase YjiC (YdhE family)